ncbi:unnamed protein product [Clonostachys rhizophaga]|uniref:Zn(2)-C6 fungal-type domain-containing protein n=1 Tax=Clonostachys rhizophaga TaxID=160324 RepID=A0A9N9YH82_9HYPO|nr:unnamed protein product [Clonostachys rhizophaga]
MATRLKVSKACINCRRRKAKCDGQHPTCGPCLGRRETGCIYTGQRDRRSGRSELSRSLAVQSRVTKPASPIRPLSTVSSHPAAETFLSESGLLSCRSTESVLSSHENRLPRNTEGPLGTEVLGPKTNSKSTDVAVPLAGDSILDTRFFGGSSASSFLKQINLAIDARLGQPLLAGGGREYNLAPRPSLAHAGNASKLNPEDPQSYILPSRRFANSLLQAYYDLVWATFPIHDWAVFKDAYDSVWQGTEPGIPEPTLYCLMNLIFALGSQFSEAVEPDQRRQVGEVFWNRGFKLFGSPSDGRASIERVQCMLLMGLYLQSTCEIHESWMTIGSAIRMAQSLGLHLPMAQNSDRRETEMARKAWHGCVYQDQIMSMTFGRPSTINSGPFDHVPLPKMIDDEFLDTQTQPSATRPDGGKSMMAFFVKSLELFNIANDIQYEAYRQQRGVRDGEVNHLISVFRLDNRLVQWAQTLPVHLHYSESIQEGESLAFRRQRVVLRARYLYARISLLRPILAELYLEEASSGSSELPKEKTLRQPLMVECTVLCFQLAHEMIDVLYSNFNHETVTGPVPAWWFGVLFIYTAATVLLAKRLQPLGKHHIPYHSDTQNDAWERAIQMLQAYSRVSQSAQRCIAALEILLAKVQNAGLNRSSEGVNMETRFPLDEMHRASVLDEPTILGRGEDADALVDFGGFNFNIDDMFWLNAPLTDFLF